jgi:NAD(P)-dependent dehydrogenase (short-subunit alcohol dehydrogenase family)
MDQLSRARTLGAILERVNSHLDHGVATATPTEQVHHSAKAATKSSRKGGEGGVRRMTLKATDAHLPSGFPERALTPGGLVLITDDGRGVARSAVELLRDRGFKTVLVGPAGSAGPDALSLDFTSPEAVSAFADRVQSEGRIAGLLHALPLRDVKPAGLDAIQWETRMASEVRGLYLLARALGDDLASTGMVSGARLVAATGMGGGFASVSGAQIDFFAGHGGIAGLVKTLAREWSEVGARVVDLDPREASETLASRLVDELLTHDDRSEVGYLKGRRIVLKPVEVELDQSERHGVSLAEGDPILITGGARGITSAMAADLARRWRPTLLIVGSSATPGEKDAPDLVGVHEPAAIKG